MLTVVKYVYNKGKSIIWECKCDCGKTSYANTDNLTRNHSTSCGCLTIINSVKSRVKHRDGTSKEYNTWTKIKGRCYNEKDQKYYRYGARGISVCDRWLESYSNFLEDMGRAPSPKHSIERIDNDGNYELNNCKWATSAEQANNNSKSVRIEHIGEVRTMKQWANYYSIPYRTLHADLKYKGKTFEEALAKRLKTPQNA